MTINEFLQNYERKAQRREIIQTYRVERMSVQNGVISLHITPDSFITKDVALMSVSPLLIVAASASLNTALSSVTGVISGVKVALISVGVALTGLCTVKNIMSNIESNNRQKAIACLVDGAVITATLFLVDVVINAVCSAFGR